jgi:hypothetical protein
LHIIFALRELLEDSLEVIVMGAKELQGLGDSCHGGRGSLDFGLECLEGYPLDTFIRVFYACNE